MHAGCRAHLRELGKDKIFKVKRNLLKANPFQQGQGRR